MLQPIKRHHIQILIKLFSKISLDMPHYNPLYKFFPDLSSHFICFVHCGRIMPINSALTVYKLA